MAKNFSHRRWADKVYTPDTDLDNVRNRVVGILLGLLVTVLVFNYIWPGKARIERRTG
jgi:hypothetical protein